jgi:O-methyltransferase
MSVLFRLGRIVNPILVKFGFRIATVEAGSKRTFAENQLLKAVSNLGRVYDRLVFDGGLTVSEDSLLIISGSMYTEFGTGLYLMYYLRRSLSLDGDVCEFGVGQGVISSLLASEIKNTAKNIWLFDSFEGFAEPSEKDIIIREGRQMGSGENIKGKLAFPESMARARLSDIRFPPERTRIVKGFIEKTVSGPALPQKVCFAYVDFDFYEPTLTALGFLDKVIRPGGYIIVDDYNFFSQGAKTAVDEFFAARKERYSLLFPEKTGEHICILSRKI